jgi:DNA polymerase-3 subunit chi
MTQVDFYLLADQDGEGRLRFTCRLVEKAYSQGRRVYVNAASDTEVEDLDRLLWTFRDGSFVPHGPLGAADPLLTPVLLGCGREPGDEDDVLINLTADVPGFFSRFDRVAEVIDADPERRRCGRERYRFYRDRGYPLNLHEITQ